MDEDQFPEGLKRKIVPTSLIFRSQKPEGLSKSLVEQVVS